jgi:hypothetical protein
MPAVYLRSEHFPTYVVYEDLVAHLQALGFARPEIISEIRISPGSIIVEFWNESMRRISTTMVDIVDAKEANDG